MSTPFYDLASLVLVPSGYKASKVYAQKPLTTDGQLTFSRASTATRVNSAGLIEKVRTNLLTYSNDFSNAAWVKSGATVTAGQTDPNGGTNASKIDLAAGGNNYIGQFSLGSGIKTNSVWLRADSAVEVSFDNGQSANAITLTTSWVRYTITQTGSAGAGVSLNNYLGVAVPQLALSFYVFQAQNETGDIATDYIATTSAAVSVGPVANIPRLDYLNSSCPRLLLEPQRTNLALYSEQLDNANYAKSLATVTPNNATSPDGHQNADTLTASAGTGTPQAYSSFSATAGAYTYSFFVKAGTHKNVFFASYSSNAFGPSFVYRDMIFNTDSGTVTASGGNLTVSTNVQNYTNGWYRVSVTYTATASGTIVFIVALAANSTTVSGTWTGSENIQVYGMQVEAGAYATSYIPTLGAAVTRLADACSKTGISSLIGQTEGTLFAVINSQQQGATFNWFNLSDNSISNWVFIGKDGTKWRNYVRASGSVIFDNSSTSIVDNTDTKIALAYKSGQIALYINGTQIATSASTFSFSSALSKLSIGDISAPVGDSAKYEEIIVFPTRLTNAQLAELTTL